MVRSRSRLTFVVNAAVVTLIALIALALAGCGSSSKASGSNNNGTATPARPLTSDGQPATVGIATTGLGSILVDAQGRTLYLFQKDSGTTSACTGACATFWPPLTVTGTPTVGNGANATLLSTAKQSNGKTQVVYNGHLVYLYTGDHNPGDTTGQGLVAFGGGWFALGSGGNQVSGSTTPSTSGSSGGGSGY
jgi:predicted lipoprotein with Yx(FWY)xxD motif